MSYASLLATGTAVKHRRFVETCGETDSVKEKVLFVLSHLRSEPATHHANTVVSVKPHILVASF